MIKITITNQKSPLSKRHYTLYPMSLQQDIEKMRRNAPEDQCGGAAFICTQPVLGRDENPYFRLTCNKTEGSILCFVKMIFRTGMEC